MRILVDGIDLAGKSTIAAGLARALSLPHRRGPGGVLGRVAGARHARGERGALTTWLFVAAAALDDRQGVIEIGVDHTIALAELLGRPLAARAAAEVAACQPDFDAVIYVACDEDERRRRLAARATPDALDRLIVEDPSRARALEQHLRELVLARPRAICLDTSRMPIPSAILRARAHVDRLVTRRVDQGACTGLLSRR
jgi:thymidylate kinase